MENTSTNQEGIISDDSIRNSDSKNSANTIENIPIIKEGTTDDSPAKKRETTRSEIAVFYVRAYFITIGLSFVIGLIRCFAVKDYIDVLIAISGILSGPLGFIIGYYFKAGEKE